MKRAILIGSALAMACASTTRDETDYFEQASGNPDADAGDDGDGGDGGDGADDGDGGDGGDDGGDDGGGTVLDVGNPGDESACACAPKSDLIYLLSWDGLSLGSVWTFDPSTLEFQQEAAIGCSPGAVDTVFSMGVGRDARAWIEYAPSGDLMTLDVNTGECSDPGFAPGQHGFSQFGLAFVSESEDNPCDDLYAIRRTGTIPSECPGQACGSLGVIDPDSAKLEIINGVSWDGGELTGTGDGRLFAFVGVAPAKLVEFDKDTGAQINVIELTGLELTDAFAFAFWGGDFYFFTEANDTLPGLPEGTSRVVKLDYDASDGNGHTLATIVPSAPILIAGAGVSTCAPITPVG